MDRAEFLTAVTAYAVPAGDDSPFFALLMRDYDGMSRTGFCAYTAANTVFSVNFRTGTEEISQPTAEDIGQIPQ